MAWAEPLTATADTSVRGIVTVRCRDASRLLVAEVLYKYDLASGCSFLGEISLRSRDASVRQQTRALALMIRECVRSALELGLTTYHAEILPNMDVFARLVAGSNKPRTRSGLSLAQGSLAELSQLVDERQLPDGRLKFATPTDEQRIADDAPVR